MTVPIAHASFVRRPLALRPAGWFKGPRLLSAGREIDGKKNRFEVRDDTERTRVVQLKSRFLDPLPVLEIDGEPVQLGRPLAWYEYVWMGIPVVLVVAGGALGGAIGFAAAYTSARVFRSERSPVAKYVVSGLVSVSAAVVFIVLAGVVQLALAG